MSLSLIQGAAGVMILVLGRELSFLFSAADGSFSRFPPDAAPAFCLAFMV